MKLSQLSILFVGIMLTIIVQTDIKTNNLKTAAGARKDMDYFMNQAIDSAVDTLMQTDTSSGADRMDKDGAVDNFLSSMYVSLGILSDPLAQEKLLAYIPVIAVTDVDGYYIMYSELYTGTDGCTYISRRWTEKLPYTYEDTNFIYRFTLENNIILFDKNRILDKTGTYQVFETGILDIRMDSEYSSLRAAIGSGSFLLNDEAFQLVRLQAIITQLEKDFSYHISKHSRIAEHFGIKYRFTLPVNDASEWNKALEGKGIVIMFQGMPLDNDNTAVYNRMAFSGAGVRKGNIYYIEQQGWYYLYHKEGCPLLIENPDIREEHYSSVEECASLGAYACEACDPSGIHAPNYSP